MPLLFEGKRISELKAGQDTDEGKFLVDYENWKQEIYKLAGNKKTLILNYVSTVVTPANIYDPNSRPETPQGWAIMAKQMFVGSDYVGEVTFFDHEKRDKNGKSVFQPRRIDFNGKSTLSVLRDLDKLIFMVYVSTFCSKAEWLHNQNVEHKYDVFEVVDSSRKADEYLANARLESKAKSIILGETIDLKRDEESYRVLASSYGIVMVSTFTLAEVQEKMDRLIFYRNAQKGVPSYNYKRMRNFVEDASNMGLMVEVGALIQRGMDINVLTVSKHGIKAFWKYRDVDSNLNLKLCEAPLKERKNALKNYFIKNPEEYERIFEFISKKEQKLKK